MRECAGPLLFAVEALPPRAWKVLPAAAGEAMSRLIKSTSLVEAVVADGTPGLVLVQEESMEHRPSLLHELTPAEILRYWALLTPEQRAVFLEQRALASALAVDSPLVAAVAFTGDGESTRRPPLTRTRPRWPAAAAAGHGIASLVIRRSPVARKWMALSLGASRRRPDSLWPGPGPSQVARSEAGELRRGSPQRALQGPGGPPALDVRAPCGRPWRPRDRAEVGAVAMGAPAGYARQGVAALIRTIVRSLEQDPAALTSVLRRILLALETTTGN